MSSQAVDHNFLPEDKKVLQETEDLLK